MRHLLRHFRSASVAVLFAVLVAVNGCDIRKYSVMTRIEPDGRLNRGVSIPRDWTLPPEALVAPKTYPPSTQPGDYILNKEWADLWSQESPELKAGVGESGKTIVAGGEFPSAEHIPRNYHLIAYPLDDRASTNRIDHSLDDCLLFNVDNWTETITETVQLGEFVDTVDEMALMLLPPFQTTVDDILGKEYDFKDLHTFGRERLDPLVRDFVLLLYEAAGAGFGAKPRPQDLPVMKNRLRTIGFDLPLNESGDDVDGDKMSTVLTDYVRDLFRTTVRLRATGRYLNTEQAEQLMKRFGWEPEKDSTSRPASGPATATSPTSQPATQESSVWDSIAEAFPQRFEVMNGRTLEAMWFLWGARIGGANRG
ncbi:MAG TPA: hypothetical protein VLM89_01550, partial [Phycisphaerae bacterium]|nr:hypothetical protein [Phycisphaerae bacterium]